MYIHVPTDAGGYGLKSATQMRRQQEIATDVESSVKKALVSTS